MKTGIWALVVASLVLIGCENGSKQSMDSANKNVDAANALSQEAATEYLVATTIKNKLLKQSPIMASWSPEQLDKLKALYISSKAKFLDARSRFAKALDRTPNAANTKVTKDSIINEMYRIDTVVASIDLNLQNIEVATPVARKQSGAPAAAAAVPVEAAASAAAAEQAAPSASAPAAE